MSAVLEQHVSRRIAYSALAGGALAVLPFAIVILAKPRSDSFVAPLVGLLIFPGTRLAYSLSGLSVHTGLLLLGAVLNWILFTAIILAAWSLGNRLRQGRLAVNWVIYLSSYQSLTS